MVDVCIACDRGSLLTIRAKTAMAHMDFGDLPATKQPLQTSKFI